MIQEIEVNKPSVPWTGFDVLLLFSLWLAPFIASIVIVFLNQPPIVATVTDTQNYKHPIVQLIEQSQCSPIVFIIIFLSVVIVAPMIEEFLFRMLLQGWLEVKLRQFKVPNASGIAIVGVSIFFAVIHINNHAVIDVQALLVGIVMSSVFSLMVFATGIIYLTQARNLRVADYVFVKERYVRPHFFTCVGGSLLAIMLCLTLNATLMLYYPGTNLAPIAIFFFSLALGVLYSRTQNLADCILFHACLNGISLALAWLSI